MKFGGLVAGGVLGTDAVEVLAAEEGLLATTFGEEVDWLTELLFW
jgi:hypothetical protein